MSGKPQYDESEVIAAAINVFWRHGYAAASVSDLTEATGLSRSSLYQRFQDKDGLFQEALAAYSARLLARMRSFEGQTARERLRTLLLAFLPQGASRPAGCLVARSCAELPDLSAASGAAALAGLEDQRAIFVDLLRKGVAAEPFAVQPQREWEEGLRRLQEQAKRLANILLNLWLIPRWGAVGAAWSTLICYGVLAASIWVVTIAAARVDHKGTLRRSRPTPASVGGGVAT